jgi:hypothetical protein
MFEPFFFIPIVSLRLLPVIDARENDEIAGVVSAQAFVDEER